MRKLIAAAVGMTLSASALAESPAPPPATPNPASVAVPEIDVGRDPNIVSNGWKYFYFWRPGTTYQQAFADFSDCYRFLPIPNAAGDVPSFVPFGKQPNAAKVEPIYVNNYGLVGAVIGAMVAGPLERRLRQSRMRRCMEPRGYDRFPAPEAAWEAIIDNYSPRSIAVQAKLASGPKPDADPLPVTR